MFLLPEWRKPSLLGNGAHFNHLNVLGKNGDKNKLHAVRSRDIFFFIFCPPIHLDSFLTVSLPLCSVTTCSYTGICKRVADTPGGDTA